VTDADLVARAREGDTAAFGELVGRHQSAVYRAALAAVGTPADADDVAQEAFLSAFTQLHGFRGDASFKTWLLTITWNHAINRRRSVGRWLRRFATNQGGADVLFDVASPEPTPEQLAADVQLRRHIRREILRLPAKLRDALLLAQSGEHTYEEIGAMVNAPVGTIKWRVSEARRLVRERLRASGYADAR
jgi:RNA polymerase sigma-70 factor, ECF subfamily